MRNKQMAGLVGLCMTVFAGCLIGATANTAHAEQKAIADLFSPSAMTLVPMQSDGEFLYAQKGIEISSTDTAQSIEWKEDVIGTFSFEYIPMYVNGSCTANIFETEFTDINSGDSFKVIVGHKGTAEVYVEINGVKAGVYYYQGEERGMTQTANASGEYTSFSADKIKITFNPDDMSVYVGSAENKQSLVWFFHEQENDGYDIGMRLPSFNQYRVSFAITEFLGDNGSILLYKVNDYALDSFIFEGSSAPSIFADYKYNGIKGQEYQLPMAQAYDIADGIIDTSLRIYNENGKQVGENISVFVPDDSGVYSAVYTAKNSNGQTAEKTYLFEVYETTQVSEYEIDWDLKEEYAVGETITLPESILSGGLLRYGEEIGKLTLQRNGVTLLSYENILSGISYTFPKKGDYKVVYHLGGDSVVTYSINVIDAETRFIIENLQSSYIKGTYVDCSSAYVLINEERVPFDFSVEYPDGKKYKNKIFQANQTGVYRLRATTNIFGGNFVFEKEFFVDIKTSELFESVAEGVQISHGASTFSNKQGVKISVTKSASLIEYTQPIDITSFVGQTEKSAQGHTILSEKAKPLIEFSVDPASFQTSAAGNVKVYITDAENPNNKITIHVRSEGSSYWSYITAGATGQRDTGFNIKSGENTTLDGNEGILWTGKYGYPIYHSFKGLITENFTAKDSKISLYYDDETKQILTTARLAGSDCSHVVTDLDDLGYHKDSLWNGFSSNKVYISFMLGELTTPSANLFVYSVAGTEFSLDYLSHEKQPTIDVSMNDFQVGLKGKTFPLPTVAAYDFSGKEIEKLTCKVYYENEGKRYDVLINNGYFATLRSGKYVIVYTAIDRFGNRATKELVVDAIEEKEALTITCPENVVEAYPSNGLAGHSVFVVPLSELVVQNEIGKAIISRNVYYIANGIKQEVVCEEDAFQAEKVGAYIVEYTAVDVVNRVATFTYQIDIQAPQDPVIIGNIPHYVGFVRGNSYSIADVYLIDYTQSEEIQKADVYINGSLYSNSVFKLDKAIEAEEILGETQEIVTLEYRYADETLLSYTIPVKTIYKNSTITVANRPITQQKLLMERYFVCEDGVSATTTMNHILITAQSDGSALHFAQPIASMQAEWKFGTNKEQNAEANSEFAKESNIKKLTIRIIDAMDCDKQLYVDLMTDTATGKVVLCINGETSTTFSGSLIGESWNFIHLKYNNTTQTFYDAQTNTSLLTPLTYENGRNFEGFGDLIYVSFSMERLETNTVAQIRLHSLNGQTFSNVLSEDKGAPIISVNGSANGVYQVGTVLKTFTATANDVLSDVEEFYVSVTLEKDGQIQTVYSIDGKPIDKVSPNQEYSFELKMMGTYRIIYYAKDKAVETESILVITAIDRISPSINVNGKIPETVKQNSQVTVPKAEVTFMETNIDNLQYVVYITPSNCYEMVKEGSFIANELGEYIIRYYALDAYGNYTIKEYSLICEK